MTKPKTSAALDKAFQIILSLPPFKSENAMNAAAVAEMEPEVIEDAGDAAPAGKKARIPVDKATVGTVYATAEEATANPVKNVSGEVQDSYRVYNVTKGEGGESVGFIRAKDEVQAIGLYASSKGYVAVSLNPRGRGSEKGKPSDQQIAFGKMLIGTGNKQLIDSFLATIPVQYHSLFSGL